MLLSDISEFTQKWLNYQSLWDLSPEMVYSNLGSDVDQWSSLVTEIQEARTMIDNEENMQYFGPVLVKHVKILHFNLKIGLNSK